MSSMKMHTPDLSAENVEKLLSLFPNVATETRDEKGALVRGVDWDLLRQELSDRIVEGPDERYRLDWPGKREAMLLANAPIAKTLRPCRQESVDFDTTKNLFIEGDNLDALKLLQETYLGKVKLIYIDPPYNTGNDFIYEDDFAEDTESYLQRSNQKDEQGNRLVANTESNGRFHSDWLNMMYPRLKLARNLLRDDGVIFISIDDGETANLRRLCDEVFGAENFMNEIIWKKSYGGGSKSKHLVNLHESIILYAKEKIKVPAIVLPPDPGVLKYYKYKDEKFELRGPYRKQPLSTNSMDDRDNLKYPIIYNGLEIWPEKQWQWSKERAEKALRNNELVIAKRGDSWVVDYKQYLREEDGEERGSKLFTIIDGFYTQQGSKEIEELFGDQKAFSFPKPTGLLAKLLQLTNGDDIVLDFFAGSGTTAHALFKLNSDDFGDRHFILVQIPEVTEREGYQTIAEITVERIRRAGKKILEEWQAKQIKPFQGNMLEAAEPSVPATPPDVGFRVLKIDSSNFDESFYKKPDEVQQTELLGMVDNIKPDRSGEDLLFQVLLDWGVDLSYPIVRESMLGKTVYFVNDTGLAACFDKGVSEELIRAIAARKPLRAVFRDGSFDRDDTKINTAQIFAQISPSTDVRTI